MLLSIGFQNYLRLNDDELTWKTDKGISKSVRKSYAEELDIVESAEANV
jgi:hypothetical protein